MMIDAHNHADWYAVTCENFIRDMDENGIDVTWLLSCEIPEGEYNPSEVSLFPCIFGSDRTCVPFERALPYVEKYPDRFVLGFAPDPRRPDALDRLKYAVKAYGVRVCGEVKFRMMVDNFDAVALFRWCGENGLPVTVHLDYPIPHGDGHYPRPNYWYGGDIDTLERAMIACPDTVFLGHAPGFWSHISGDDQGLTKSYPQGKVLPGGKVLRLLDKYPNLYCDISAGSGNNALSRDPEFAKKFLTDYADRILYARDTFFKLHKEFLLSLGLAQETLDKIFYKNALKLVPLEGRK